LARIEPEGPTLLRRAQMLPRILTAPLRADPDFLIIGVQKGGTTSLYSILAQHPAVDEAWKKEVHYFDLRFRRGPAWYRAHFPTRRAQREGGDQQRRFSGEATPYYLFHPHVPRRVRQALPKVRLVALLRDPVARAYSHYNHLVRLGHESLSFEDAVRKEGERLAGEMDQLVQDEWHYSVNLRNYSYLTRGHYAEQLERWWAEFPREQLLVLKSEDFYQRPREIWPRVIAHLGLPDWSPAEFREYNAGRYPEMSPELARWLKDYFEPHNARLYALLGEDWGW
jgi:hypothetical protein